MAKSRYSEVHRRMCWSELLTEEENGKLRCLVETRCPGQTHLVAAVIQLYIPEPPTFTNWTKAHCGVLCVMKDNDQSCYLKLLCLVRGQVIWELKLSGNENYHAPKPFFHTIITTGSQFGLNFADECEAYAVLSALRRNLLDKRRRALNRRLSKSDIGIPTNFRLVRHIGWDNERGFSLYNIDDRTREHLVNDFLGQLNSLPRHYVSKMRGSIRIRKKRITKEDIGMPFNFRHVTHVGRDERPLTNY